LREFCQQKKNWQIGGVKSVPSGVYGSIAAPNQQPIPKPTNVAVPITPAITQKTLGSGVANGFCGLERGSFSTEGVGGSGNAGCAAGNDGAAGSVAAAGTTEGLGGVCSTGGAGGGGGGCSLMARARNVILQVGHLIIFPRTRSRTRILRLQPVHWTRIGMVGSDFNISGRRNYCTAGSHGKA
jgi:hypothetical protein